jgi:DNA-directed RNA polymerase subunit RPC12/RpoP
MPLLTCPTCGRRVRVEPRQYGRALRCPKCGGRFLADPTLPPDAHVEDYAGEAPPVQRPPAEVPSEPPEPVVEPAYRPPAVAVVRDRIPVNPFAVIAVLLGFLSVALAGAVAVACLASSAGGVLLVGSGTAAVLAWLAVVAAVAGLVFGGAATLHPPRGLAVAGVALSVLGLSAGAWCAVFAALLPEIWVSLFRVGRGG